jgi:hypothetical protein
MRLLTELSVRLGQNVANPLSVLAGEWLSQRKAPDQSDRRERMTPISSPCPYSQIRTLARCVTFITMIHNLPPTPAFRDEPTDSAVAEIVLRVIAEFTGVKLML